MAWELVGLYHIEYHDSHGIECHVCMYGEDMQEIMDQLVDFLGNGEGPERDEPISIVREHHMLAIEV